MPAFSPISWASLFESESPADFALVLRVLKKSGQPFLLLPLSPALAARALALYPAQSRFARVAKWTLGTSLRARLPLPMRCESVPVSLNDPFPRFLLNLTGMKTQEFPALAILAGNPLTEGRRFILLLFDADGLPAFVVKAGVGAASKRLVRHESAFLQSASAEIPGLPKFRGLFASEQVDAVALDFVKGDSPRGEDRDAIGKLLTGWLRKTERIHAAATPAWQTLEKSHFGHPVFAKIAAALGKMEFCPAWNHGDFAPWNIKVSPMDGSWTVLDWERGERTGFPGWDWFHYRTQTGILVGKAGPEKLLANAEGLLNSPQFQNYAAAAGISGIVRVLFGAYLFYCVEVLRPSEGAATARAFLDLIGRRWFAPSTGNR